MVSPDNEHAPQQPIEDATPEPSPRKRGGFGRALARALSWTLSGVLLLAALAIAGGYAAIYFQDRDPRLKAVAKIVEQGVDMAHDRARSFTEAPVGDAGGKIATPARRMAPVEEKGREDGVDPDAGKTAPPQLDPEAVRQAQRDAEEAVKRAEAEAEEKAQAEAAARAEEERARSEAETAEKRAAGEKLARETAELAAREKARRVAAQSAAASPGSDELTAHDLVTGLEGRVDELGDEIKTLRERLESPKNETRAAPEALAEKPAPDRDSGAAQIVVAYTLQRRLEAGKPFNDELAALGRLGADSAALDALRPLAEGAPTAARLHAEFAALARKIHVPEAGHAEDLTEQLSKLVKVRPPGQSAAADKSVDGILARIDAALAHNDLVAAETALASLPEGAQDETRSFAGKLHARIEADKAADALVHGAITALGKN